MEEMRQCIAVWKLNPKLTCHVCAHTHTHTHPIIYEIKREFFAWQLSLTLQNVPLILLQMIDCPPEHLSLF